MATVAATAVLGVVIALIFWALHKWMKQVSKCLCSLTFLSRFVFNHIELDFHQVKPKNSNSF